MGLPMPATRRAHDIRRCLEASLVAVTFWATCLAAVPGHAHAAVNRAKSAGAFVDSIGVNTHLWFVDTAYGNYDAVKARLGDLGVRHIRDVLIAGTWTSSTFYRRLNDLSRTLGIRATLAMSHEWGTFDRQIDALRTELRGDVRAVEGYNEPDFFIGGSGWAARTRAHQQALHARVKGDPSLASLRVLAPSLAFPWSFDALGDLSSHADRANAHPYPVDQLPHQATYGRTLDRALTDARKSAARTVQATETGYHTLAGINFGVTEEVAGVYLLRLPFEYFRRGVERSFLYELVDQKPDATRSDSERHYGLLRNDFSEKPAYGALKRLIVLLRDEPGTSGGGSLRYRLGGDLEDVQSLLLGKHDGSFYLCLWQRSPVWDRERKTELFPSERRVTVKLEERVRGAEVYRPRVSGARIDSYRRPKQLRLSVPADVVVVKVTPRSVRSTLASMAAAAVRRLSRAGRARLIRRRQFRVTGRPLLEGRYVIQLLARPTGRGRTRTRAIASHRSTVRRTGRGTLLVRLGRDGRRLLKKARGRLTLRLAFSDRSNRVIAVRRSFTLRR
jgi:hypothetical protein